MKYSNQDFDEKQAEQFTQLNRVKHAKVLNAYLSRMSLPDIEAIYRTQKLAWMASMHYGTSAQLSAQTKASECVTDAIGHLIDHDIKLIETITRRANQQR